ncbi:transmembrane protein 236-like isoform X1 [Entelurus aequoreus]|uniref:transmembrane protein 236-like isoform X1 n=2 Tax=Entelurus aequoreus TaxID=161455 RepID=UPI002B1CF713|nr:transmembrane protein 236-like isoform X1 [Entelurus aequoreus]XP_061879764.1 transmembrane protein 236-like isoform X1 [Entelurus aequoreus]
MASGKTVKLLVYELLQFTALSGTVLVVTERFACLMSEVKGRDDMTYWLVVAVSVAYLTSATLLVWLPFKYHILKRRRGTKRWRPTFLLHVILCTLPCFAIFMASSQSLCDLQVQVNCNLRLDHFAELPVSLVMFSLICVDLVERIRPCRLLGQEADSLDLTFDLPGPILTHLEPVSCVSGQPPSEEVQPNDAPASPADPKNQPVAPRRPQGVSGRSVPLRSKTSGAAYLYSSSPSRRFAGPLGFLRRKDVRSEVFVDCFLFWFDTVEMVRVSGQPAVFFSPWVYPVFILAFLSTLRMALVPRSPWLSSAGVALQDLPFFVLRVALMAAFGLVTPVLYPLKNALVGLAFFYFTFVTKMKIFKRRSMF